MGLAAATFVLPLLRGSYILRTWRLFYCLSAAARLYGFTKPAAARIILSGNLPNSGSGAIAGRAGPNAVMLVPKKNTELPAAAMFDSDTETNLNQKPVSLDNISR